MRELGSLCRDNAILPTSYTIPPNRVARDEIPFSSGGFGDVYRGVYNGSDVCIKRMREQTQDPPDKLHVRDYVAVFPCIVTSESCRRSVGKL